MTMNKKNIFIFILFVSVVIAPFVIREVWYIGEFWYDFKETKKFSKSLLGIDQISEQEAAFLKNPNMVLAFILMDKYKNIWEIRDVQKVEYYGKKAIDLGGDSASFGFLINFWMASIYHEKKLDDRACYYFNKAMGLCNEEELFVNKKTMELENVVKDNALNSEFLLQEGFDDQFVKFCQQQEMKKSGIDSN